MNSVFTTVLLPIALAFVMLGLGLGLTIADFRRVVAYPKAVVIALACQIILLPAICFGLVVALDVPAALAVGLMLLAASPGGSSANIFSHLFGGHVAVNVTLTAVNSLLAVVTLPLILNASIAHFLDDSDGIGLQFEKVLQVFGLVLIPVAIGMFIRAKAVDFASRMHNPVKYFSIIVLFILIIGAVLKDREHVVEYFESVGLAALLFNLLSLAVGYLVPRLAKVERSQAIAAAFEVGIHNATLAITIALSPALLDSTEMAIPAAVYTMIMFFTAGAFGALMRRSAKAAAV